MQSQKHQNDLYSFPRPKQTNRQNNNNNNKNNKKLQNKHQQKRNDGTYQKRYPTYKPKEALK